MNGDGARRRNPRGAGSQLRTEIVHAAGRLVDGGGSEAVTLRAVAREVGIAAPSIYAHFADRDAVLAAVADETLAELRAALDAAAELDDPVRRLHAVCGAYVAVAGERPRRYALVFASGSPAGQSDHPAGRRLSAKAVGVLAAAVRSCVEAGLSESRSPLQDATALWVALHGYATARAQVPAYPWPADDELVRTFVERLALLRPGTA